MTIYFEAKGDVEMNRPKPVRGSTPQPDHIMVSFNGDARTCMAVTWRTDVSVTSGYVEVREDGSDKARRVDAATAPFESDIDSSSMFWAHLTDLKPGTRYFYTCGDETHRSAEYDFRTQPENAEKFKFLVVSDQQKGDPFECPDYSHFQQLMLDFLVKNPDTAFIFTAGDNTDCGQHEVQWNGAFSGLIGIAEHVPVMMTIGNHDNRGFRDYAKGEGRFYAEPAEYFAKQFKGSYPDNGPKNWKTENYAFDYGNAHFVSIGVNGQDEVNDWLIEELGQCKQTWKIAASHFPVCYTGSNLQNYDVFPVMTESIEMFDLMFSGHEHSFGRSFPRRREELFDKPSQGTVHITLGNSNQNPPGTRALPKVWHNAFYTMEEQTSMVAVCEVEGDRLTLTCMLEDGRIADRCVIDKGRDVIEPYALAPKFNRTRMMYKGADLGLCQADTPCEEKDGVWYAPLAVLFRYFGGTVETRKDQVYLEAYNHSALFTQGSVTVETDRGVVSLEHPVYRGARGQLYIPLDGSMELFDMRWYYAKRNNFILIEHESEDRPVPVQP